MTDTPISLAKPRLVQPRLWRGLALASTAVTLATAPAFGDAAKSNVTIAAEMGATLWLAETQGGEGGEAGAIAGASDDVAYLAQLSIVEGHIVAAMDLYRRGQVDEAIGLSYHPEAEMMDEVRERLAAHGMADITPAMTAFSKSLETAAPVADAEAALAVVQAAIAAAQASEKAELKTRFAAITVVLRAAASEYASSTEGGVVGDVMAYHESHAFVEVARSLASGLAALPETKDAADKALAAMQGADEAFGDMTSATLEARDPAILLAVAAKVELIASSVR